MGRLIIWEGRRYSPETSYVPPIYRFIAFLDEIRKDIQERRFIKEQQKQQREHWLRQ